MNNQPISVVMATYNGEKYVKDQLVSILNQSYLPKEIIISDDNSTDKTRAIVSEIAGSSQISIRLIHNLDRLGFRNNFLSASRFATGDWIAFCDQDDLWSPNKLERCSNFIDDPSVNLVVHQARLIDKNGNPIGKFHQKIRTTCKRPQLDYDVWSTFWGFSMMVRRSVLQSVPDTSRFIDYIDPRHQIAHDRWAFFLSQTLGRIVEIAEELADYRQHSENLFGASKSRRRQLFSDLASDNAVYVNATKGMLSVVESLQSVSLTEFPAFDKERTMVVYKRALNLVEARQKIYSSGPLVGMVQVFLNLATGLYQEPIDQKIRWKSFGKDLFACVTSIGRK